MALTVTGAGGLALFVGVLVIGHIVGSYDLDEVLASGDVIRRHDLYFPALVLLLIVPVVWVFVAFLVLLFRCAREQPATASA